MKESMYTIYEDNSNEMQVKLKELSKVLESCTRLHQELMDATQALSGLRVTIGIKKQDWWLVISPLPFFTCVRLSSFTEENQSPAQLYS